jgi:putative solute:sodium symporter small subunit
MTPELPDNTNPVAALAALAAAREQHWAGTRRLTAVLLLLWLSTSFCAVFFARELAGLSVFGWPLSFYLAAQGASLVYLAILGVYAWRMRQLDRALRARLGLPLRAGGGR